jgi:NAD-dependent SIR2 family protein deacetylase
VYVIVIGTTLQFPYLRKRIINKAKSRGAHVIHVNPERPQPLKDGETWVASVNELEAMFTC